jgi:hypothetical protein
MVGSLSVVIIAVSPAKVAVVEPGEVGRSAVYSRYKSSPNTLPCGIPAFIDDSFEYSVSAFTRK